MSRQPVVDQVKAEPCPHDPTFGEYRERGIVDLVCFRCAATLDVLEVPVRL